MVKHVPEIIIEHGAKQSLRQACNYIKKDSLQNAEKVKSKILNSIKALAINPQKHPPDKYRFNNNGDYRAYEICKYRITYHISHSYIRIIRIRHARMNPLVY